MEEGASIYGSGAHPYIDVLHFSIQKRVHPYIEEGTSTYERGHIFPYGRGHIHIWRMAHPSMEEGTSTLYYLWRWG